MIPSKRRSTISIAMATFNGEDHVEEQLESLAAQTLLPFELVVTDDGSTDRTLSVLRKFAETSPFPVRIYENSERLGYADNFFNAASLCQGKWVSFCDQDDIWSSKKIEICSELLMRKDVCLVSHNSLLIDENGTELTAKMRYFRLRRVIHEKKYWGVYFGFTITFKRDQIMKYVRALEMRPFQHYGIPHDQFVTFIAAITGKIAGSDQFLTRYRRHRRNVSSSPFGEQIEREARVQIAYRVLRQRNAILNHLNKVVPAGDKLDRKFVLMTALYLRRRLVLYNWNAAVLYRCAWLTRSFLLGTYSDRARAGLGSRALILDIYNIIRSVFNLVDVTHDGRDGN